ncbi:MAG: LysR family transcriptional regulator [Rhodospirillales bacterium]|nr:LysR family transcriptional regulator [Rhodospirillales bacterium]
MARTSSVTKAAAELNVTAGAVSQQLRQLQESLRVGLFARQRGRLVLTDSGLYLASRLANCFEQIDRAVREVAGDPESRKLRLKVTPTFAIRWLVPRLPHFYTENPDFEIEVGTYPRQEDAWVDEVDFVVRHGRGDWSDASSDLIFEDALTPVCSPATAATLRLPRDLASQNLLHSMMRTDAWELWLAAEGLTTLRSRRTTKLANAAVTYRAAIDGFGVALAQIPYVREDLDAGRLVMPFERILRTGSGYHLAYAHRKSGYPNISVFRKWMQDVPKDRMM